VLVAVTLLGPGCGAALGKRHDGTLAQPVVVGVFSVD